MIFRRLARPITVLVALWCLWQISKSRLKTLFPLIGKLIVANGTDVTPLSKVAKATVAANSLNSSFVHQALQTHKVQNDIHGYTHFIATNELVGDISETDPKRRPRGAWSKPAYLLSIIVAELAKPKNDRLGWVFWFDADTVVMNPHTPLEIFLPPDNAMPEVSNVNLLMSANWDGLNSGAFALRVCPWSVSLLSLVLAYPIYNVHKLKTDRFRDQSAFQWLLQSPDSPLTGEGKGIDRKNHWDHWVVVPMRWFNSLPINNAFAKNRDWIFKFKMTDDLFDKGTNEVVQDGKGGRVQPWKVMQGDMVVHFAGSNPVRKSWMGPWLKRAEADLPEWSNATKQIDLQVEVWDFWEMTSDRMVYERERISQKNRAKPKQRKPDIAKVSPPSVQDLKQVKDSKSLTKSTTHL